MIRSETIKAKRNKLGLTQSQLAERMGYSSYKVVQRHELEERQVSDTAWKLYKVVLEIREENK